MGKWNNTRHLMHFACLWFVGNDLIFNYVHVILFGRLTLLGLIFSFSSCRFEKIVNDKSMKLGTKEKSAENKGSSGEKNPEKGKSRKIRKWKVKKLQVIHFNFVLFSALNFS